MIKQREKLSNVESQYAHLKIFNLSVMTLAKAQVAILGKGLKRSKGIMQLVKHKDTGMYLCYLCESIVQQ